MSNLTLDGNGLTYLPNRNGRTKISSYFFVIGQHGGQQNIVRNKYLCYHFSKKKIQCTDLYRGPCYTHIETSHLISGATRLTGFY